MKKERLPVLGQVRASRESRESGGLDRRDFAWLAVGWVTSIGAMLAAGTAALRGLVPNLLYEPDLRFRIGKPEDYRDNLATFIEEIRVFVERKGNSYRAVSAVCTHLGCTVNPDGQGGGGFRCPCHGSVFDSNGRVLEGPAPKPLKCYSIAQARDGRLVVDRDREVSSDQYFVLASQADATTEESRRKETS